jgi:hypothetical protein
MAGAPVISGIGQLGLITTDGSGPGSGTQEGAFFPFTTSVSVEKTTENSKIYAYPPAGGTGTLKQVANIKGQEEWSGTMSINVQSWLELQLLLGQKSQSVSQDYFEVKTATVDSGGTITDTDLGGATVADVQVSFIEYDSTGGSPRQLEVITSGTVTANQVLLDEPNTQLEFHSSLQGLSVYYTLAKTATKNVIGIVNPTVITGLQFFGLLTTNGSTTAAGYGLYIPSLTLDGNFSIGVSGTENTVEIPFTPVLTGGYSEPVIIIEL